ncbi:MAG: glycosyltransferase [Acidobacteriia bacterium]|nr:glycosyltransferase [Terriglobia bacterium]
MAREHQAGGFRQVQQDLTDGDRVRVALFTNNYLPFCGGVTVSVETLLRGLEARGHAVWVFAPRLAGAPDPPRVIRYPSVPAATYPDFALAVPFSRRIAREVKALDFDVFHAHHPFPMIARNPMIAFTVPMAHNPLSQGRESFNSSGRATPENIRLPP